MSPKTAAKDPHVVYETRATKTLHEDPENIRKRDGDAVAAIAASLQRFGQQKPIVVLDSGKIIAGNGTFAAAKLLGWKEIDVAVTLLDEDSARAYAIADNRTGDLSHWDKGALLEALEEIDAEGDDADLFATGFTEADIERLRAAMLEGTGDDPGVDADPFAGDDPAHEDDDEPVYDDPLPDVPSNPVTKSGDVWVMGDHRIICGDCRSTDDMASLLGETKITVAVTSPPYASQRKYDDESGFKPIAPDDYVAWFDLVQSNIASAMTKDGSFFVNIKEHCEDGQRHLYVKDLTLAMARSWGWRYVDEFAWTHGGTPKTPKQRFKNGWEPIFQFTRDRHKFRPDAVMKPSADCNNTTLFGSGMHPCAEGIQKYGSTEGLKRAMKNEGPKRALAKINTAQKHLGGINADNQDGSLPNQGIPTDLRRGLAYPSNSISFPRNREALGHPAAYSIDLPKFFIKAFSDKGDAVFDPFMGSGSTLMASDQTGRPCFGTEVSPQYCDVIVKRWQNATKLDATLDGDGRSFAEVSADRVGE